MKASRTRILLVDDHAVVREGYRSLIDKDPCLEVIAEASDAASGYQAYKAHQPDVVIMDISLGGRGGIDAILHIRQWDPNARVLVFTMHDQAIYALQAMRAGARGYVMKSSTPDLLLRAVRDVAAGRLSLCPEIAQVLATHSVEDGLGGIQDLSPREFEILRMLLASKSTDEIAAALHLSRKTVANYHYMIKSKLGLASDIELLYFGLRKGLVGQDAWAGRGEHPFPQA